ncbi:unnamed protein product [Trichogramma brassicae]|uniref:Uncharacterized protein n=1 Tax=Trichogramma brassicae TaxID=86971 RepID=A0A6H5ICW7_9HYME|nr:unnamed protein product [Trichogramma brassicae]
MVGDPASGSGLYLNLTAIYCWKLDARRSLSEIYDKGTYIGEVTEEQRRDTKYDLLIRVRNCKNFTKLDVKLSLLGSSPIGQKIDTKPALLHQKWALAMKYALLNGSTYHTTPIYRQNFCIATTISDVGTLHLQQGCSARTSNTLLEASHEYSQDTNSSTLAYTGINMTRLTSAPLFSQNLTQRSLNQMHDFKACARGGAGTTQKEDPGYVISLRSGKKTPITVRAGSDRITISRSPRRGLTKLAIDGAQHSHDEVRSENHTHKRAPDAGAKAQQERMMAPEARTTLTR